MQYFAKKFDFRMLVLLITLFLAVVSYYSFYYSYEIKKRPIGRKSKALTMVLPESLEEMLWGYTTLWSIRRINLTRNHIYVPQAVMDTLSKLFQSLSLNSLNSPSLKCSFGINSTFSILPSQYGSVSWNKPLISLNFSGRATENPKPLLYSAKYMGSEFKLLDSLDKFANRVIVKNINSLNTRSADLPLTIVCVWVSKPKWIPTSTYFKRSRENFFRTAMSLFRKHYRSLFLTIGDVRWARDQLENEDVAFVRTKTIGQCLALVAACNHTIIEPTLLSLWGAFRNQGFKVSYDLPLVLRNILYAESDWLLLNVLPNNKIKQDIDKI